MLIAMGREKVCCARQLRVSRRESEVECNKATWDRQTNALSTVHEEVKDGQEQTRVRGRAL